MHVWSALRLPALPTINHGASDGGTLTALRFWCHASCVHPYDVENLRDGVTHHIHGSHGEVVIALQQVVRLAKVSRPIRV